MISMINSKVKKLFGSQNMTVLCPNPYYLEVCHKRTVLYFRNLAIIKKADKIKSRPNSALDLRPENTDCIY